MKYSGWANARGHEIGYSARKKQWVYCDTNKEYDDSRSCIKCGLYATEEGHDPCIAYLEGVKNACCGHGVKEGYVQLINGLTIRGQFDHIQYPHLTKR